MDNFPQSSQTKEDWGFFMGAFFWKKVTFFLFIGLSFNFIMTDSTQAEVKHIDLELQPDEMAMTFFNLPEGEAILLQNGSENILINSGGPTSYDALRKQLSMYNVKTIHTLILTNHLSDYRSHVAQLVNQYRVSTILTSRQLKKNLLNPDIPFSICQTWTSQKRTTIMSHLTIEKQSESPTGDSNFVLHYGKNSMLYLSNQQTYEHWVKVHKKLSEVRIIKLPDFGTRAFDSAETLKKLNPEVAIVYQKKDVEFNVTLLEQLGDQMTETYNISQVGNLTLKFTPDNYQSLPLHDGT